MIRPALFLTLFAAVNCLHCLQGTVVTGDGFQYSNSTRSFDCGAATHCFKEKLSALGDSGHKIQVIQYSCDLKNFCDNMNMKLIAGAFDCQKPYDLWVGDFCCCYLDNCNVDVPLTTPPALNTTRGPIRTHKPFPTFPTRGTVSTPTNVPTTTHNQSKAANGLFSIMSLLVVIFLVK